MNGNVLKLSDSIHIITIEKTWIELDAILQLTKTGQFSCRLI